MKIILRIFPGNRRGSFSSKEINIEKVNPTVKDIFDVCNDIDRKSSVSRGITYLKEHEKLIEGEILNIIPA